MLCGRSRRPPLRSTEEASMRFRRSPSCRCQIRGASRRPRERPPPRRSSRSTRPVDTSLSMQARTGALGAGSELRARNETRGAPGLGEDPGAGARAVTSASAP